MTCNSFLGRRVGLLGGRFAASAGKNPTGNGGARTHHGSTCRNRPRRPPLPAVVLRHAVTGSTLIRRDPAGGIAGSGSKAADAELRRREQPGGNDQHSRGQPSARVCHDRREPRHLVRIRHLTVMASITEITLLGGERYRVEGEAKQVERLILDAARGSIMQLAWLTDAESGGSIGVNPECVVMLRALGS